MPRASPSSRTERSTDLGVLAGDSSSTAYGINDAGVIVGSSFDSNENEQAVEFGSNGVVALGTLPGDTASEARGINNQGQAVGYSTPFRGQSHAVMSYAGQVIDLGVYPGGTHSMAAAINDFAVVAGADDHGDGTVWAVKWRLAHQAIGPIAGRAL